MIRWCSYCQRFLGEKAPFDVPSFTHTICDRCAERFESDEPFKDETGPLRELLLRMMASACQGDETACVPLMQEAAKLGLNTVSMLVGMLQPALYQAGLDWQDNTMSIATEHRFTAWCERVFASLPAAPPPVTHVDLLIFQAPGNSHNIGARFATRILQARGMTVLNVFPELPPDDIVAEVRRTTPKAIGLSCALPSSVPLALEMVEQLRRRLAANLHCRFILGGFAFRLGGGANPPVLGRDIDVIVDLDALKLGRDQDA